MLCVGLVDSTYLSFNVVMDQKQVDILISNQVLQILYLSLIIPCMIIINFIVYDDTVLHANIPNISLVKTTERPQPQ